MTSEIWAALLGALVAGTLALMTQLVSGWTTWLSGREARSAAWRDAAADRLARFLAATHAAILALGELAYLPQGEGGDSKPDFRSGREMQALRDRVNSTSNIIQLLDDDEVVRAVVELDRTLVRLEDEAMSTRWRRDDWRSRRNDIVGDAVDKVYASGRLALGRAALDRPNLWAAADREVLRRVGESKPGSQRPPYGS